MSLFSPLLTPETKQLGAKELIEILAAFKSELYYVGELCKSEQEAAGTLAQELYRLKQEKYMLEFRVESCLQDLRIALAELYVLGAHSGILQEFDLVWDGHPPPVSIPTPKRLVLDFVDIPMLPRAQLSAYRPASAVLIENNVAAMDGKVMRSGKTISRV